VAREPRSTIGLWDVETQTLIGEPLAVHEDVIASMALSPDGGTLAAAYVDGGVALWDVERVHPLAELVHRTGKPTSAASMSPDGRRLALLLEDYSIILWDLEHEVRIGQPILADARSMTFSPDGLVLATGGGDSSVRRWDTTSGVAIGEPFFLPPGHPFDPEEPIPTTASALAFSPDGTLLLAGGFASVWIWDLSAGIQSGEPLTADTPEAATSMDGGIGAREEVSDIAFSPDGRTFATANARSSVLWDVATRTQLGEPLGGHTGWVTGVAFSPDGHLLAAADADGTVLLWDVARRARVATLRYPGYAWDPRFDPSGGTLVVTTDDGPVLWDVALAQRIGPPLPGVDVAGAGLGAFFAPDGSLFSTSYADGTVLRWDMDETSWRGHACAIAGRSLTPEEWATYVGDEPYRETCPADASADS
jgi:WD40 repeat protein